MSLILRRIAWPIVAGMLVAAIAAAAALQWRHQQTRQELDRAASAVRLANGVRNQVSSAFLLRSRVDGGDASVDTSQVRGAILRARLLLTDWQQGREGSRNVPTVVPLPDSPLRDAVGRWANEVARFDSLLRLPRGARTAVQLRSAYTDLAFLADTIDLLVAQSSSAAQQRDDERHRLALTILAATILGLGALFGLLWVRWSAADRETASAQRALIESERRFRVLTEQLPVGVFQHARDGRVAFVNATMERIFGATATQLKGNGWFDFVHPQDRDQLVMDRTASRASSIEVAEFAFRILRGGDDAVREIILRARYFRTEQGEVDSTIGIVEDVTERRALESQLIQAQKMEAVGRLAGGVAHDFNNLLTVIGGITEIMLADRQLPEALRLDVVEVHDAAGRARALTRQLLALSRQQRIHVTDVAIADVLNRTTGLLQRVLGEHIAVSLELQSPTLTAVADAGAVEQMLLNLALNARDAMPSGGSLRLEVTGSNSGPNRVTDGEFEGPWVVISVADSGSGIPADVLPHIFEPFFTTKEVGQGTGLGLAMVQSLAAQMRGAVTVESTLGAGTTFFIFLPACSSSVASPAISAVGSRPPTAGGVLLLVEDNAPLRRVAARALREAKYTVLEAGDAAEARRLYDEHAGRIDGVISDVVLPAESGPVFVRSLREQNGDLPVLYITGFSTSEQLVRDVDSGTPMLAKPFNMRDLVTAVDQLLAK